MIHYRSLFEECSDSRKVSPTSDQALLTPIANQASALINPNKVN
jgi:hypothetical protein